MRTFRRRIWIRPRAGRYRGRLLWFTVLCIVFLVLLMCSAKFHRILPELAEAKVKYTTIQSVNETVGEVMRDGNGRFDRLIITETDADGTVQSVRTDTAKLNLLRSAITERLLQKMSAEQPQEVKVPLSNMLGMTVWSGVGPKIPVRVIPLSEVETVFADSFEQAGINQTKMQVMMQLRIRVGIMAPTLRRTVQIDTAVPIAQIVIVGDVPQSYTQIAGSESNAADIALETTP